jgi:cardiolipin synthase A/B
MGPSPASEAGGQSFRASLGGARPMNELLLAQPSISLFIAAVTTLLDLAAITLALVRRRGFSSTLAWIFAIIALPAVGAIFYFLLANPRVLRTSRIKRAARRRVRTSISGRFFAELDDPDIAALPAPSRSLLTLSKRLSGLAPTRGNALTLLTDNRQTFAQIERVMLEAKQSIWAEYYIIEDDSTGRRFLELLAERARAGVSVKLLYDAVGSAGLDSGLLDAIERAGGRTAAFLPVNPLQRRWAVHLRNHRKIIVVDGDRAFTGGMNIGDVYSGSSGKRRQMAGRRKVRAWRDTHLLIEGPGVQDLATVFAEDWCFTTDEVLPLREARVLRGEPGACVAMLPSGPDQEANATSLAYFIGITMAEERCYLTSPYFVPDEPTLRALTSAALRGVDVRLLVPSKNDVALMVYAIRSFYPRLLEAGVRIYEYQPSVLHAKTMVIDGRVCIVGSANLDVRSFRLNFEVGAIVVDDVFSGVLEQQFRLDLAKSREVLESDVQGRGFAQVLLEGAAQLLSPLL